MVSPRPSMSPGLGRDAFCGGRSTSSRAPTCRASVRNGRRGGPGDRGAARFRCCGSGCRGRPASTMSMDEWTPWKSGTRTSMPHSGRRSRMARMVMGEEFGATVFAVIAIHAGDDGELEVQGRDGLRLRGRGSSKSMVSGAPFCTAQKPQRRVQTLPAIMNVAVRRFQQSPMLGQAALSHTVCRLRSCTRALQVGVVLAYGARERAARRDEGYGVRWRPARNSMVATGSSGAPGCARGRSCWHVGKLRRLIEGGLRDEADDLAIRDGGAEFRGGCINLVSQFLEVGVGVVGEVHRYLGPVARGQV